MGEQSAEKTRSGAAFSLLLRRNCCNKLLPEKTTKIKSFLLNQEYVAGLGNIYVDEALFRAGLHPERIAGELNAKEIQALHEAIVTTLKKRSNAAARRLNPM